MNLIIPSLNFFRNVHETVEIRSIYFATASAVAHIQCQIEQQFHKIQNKKMECVLTHANVYIHIYWQINWNWNSNESKIDNTKDGRILLTAFEWFSGYPQCWCNSIKYSCSKAFVIRWSMASSRTLHLCAFDIYYKNISAHIISARNIGCFECLNIMEVVSDREKKTKETTLFRIANTHSQLQCS